jgi:cation:H+ antiporter
LLSSDADFRQRLGVAAACTVPGLLVRLSGGAISYPVQLVAYGAAVIAASFMLAWACEAAQVDVAHGLVVAIVAFVAILPEYIVELHFAFTGQAQYVAANLTGASRLLLGCAIALPAAVALMPKHKLGRVELPEPHRIELAVLLAGSLWSMRSVLSGRLTLLDAVVLIGLYGVYLRRTITAGGESPEPEGVAATLAALPRDERRRWVVRLMGYAGFVILATAVPFGDAVLGAGAIVGISPFLMLQWIVPIATETPELVVAFVLLKHGRGGQSIAVLLAGAVSQYTLALGTLPVAFHLGAGTGPRADRALPDRRRRALRRRLADRPSAQPRGLLDHARAVRRAVARADGVHALHVRDRVLGGRDRCPAGRAPAAARAAQGPARTTPCSARRRSGPYPTRPFAYAVTSCSRGKPLPPAVA